MKEEELMEQKRNSKYITADDFYDEELSALGNMIKFAQYHVEQELIAANKNAQLEHREYSKFGGKIEKTMLMGQEINLEDQFYVGIEEYSILNSYPLKNIK